MVECLSFACGIRLIVLGFLENKCNNLNLNCLNINDEIEVYNNDLQMINLLSLSITLFI